MSIRYLSFKLFAIFFALLACSYSSATRAQQNMLVEEIRPLAVPSERLTLLVNEALKETVHLQHAERIRRLRSMLGGSLKAEFFEYLLPRDKHGLTNYPFDLPVLRVVFNQNVFFNFNRHDLRDDASVIIDVMAANLKKEPPGLALFIAGHTDSQGEADYNYQLGLQRATAVATALVTHDVYRASVYRVSFGEAVPIASNRTIVERARNRRVEFLFSVDAKAVAAWLERQEVNYCRDKIDNCRFRQTFDAAKVEVEPTVTKQIQELNRNTERLILSHGKTDVEIERKKIEVKIGRERFAIDLGRR